MKGRLDGEVVLMVCGEEGIKSAAVTERGGDGGGVWIQSKIFFDCLLLTFHTIPRNNEY
jgi:hypothetical protein